MNLITLADLTCNEGLYFRFITMVAKTDLDYDILIEAENNSEIDKYYKELKARGWYDFVDDFIIPEWNIVGVRIDTKLSYPRTIKVDQITCENTLSIVGQIKSLREIKF
tara:strand:- start:20025 stop:20351 length:327 start_codon:yes stop_codon:yes gene_type:complete